MAFLVGAPFSVAFEPELVGVGGELASGALVVLESALRLGLLPELGPEVGLPVLDPAGVVRLLEVAFPGFNGGLVADLKRLLRAEVRVGALRGRGATIGFDRGERFSLDPKAGEKPLDVGIAPIGLEAFDGVDASRFRGLGEECCPIVEAASCRAKQRSIARAWEGPGLLRGLRTAPRSGPTAPAESRRLGRSMTRRGRPESAQGGFGGGWSLQAEVTKASLAVPVTRGSGYTVPRRSRATLCGPPSGAGAALVGTGGGGDRLWRAEVGVPTRFAGRDVSTLDGCRSTALSP